LADYRDRYAELRDAGADVVALSVDDRVRAQAMTRELALPFAILCDPGREVVTAWGLLNRAEKGGIAFPATFLIDRDRKVRYRSLESVGRRVSSDEMVSYVRATGANLPVAEPRPARLNPGAMFLRAITNALRRGARQPRSES